MTRPDRVGRPLHPPGRADPPIVGHRVAVRAVQPMGPLVDLRRARLDRLDPFHIRHAAGAQHAHHLGHGHRAELLGDQQVDQIIRVRQAPARQWRDRHRPVQAQRRDVSTRPFDVVGQAVDDVPLVGPKRRRQATVSAPQMHDQPTAHTGGIEDRLGTRFDVRFRLPEPGGHDRRRRDQCRHRASHRCILPCLHRRSIRRTADRINAPRKSSCPHAATR